MENKDVYLTARILKERHGPDAEDQAAENVKMMLRMGYTDAAVEWMRIQTAIFELEADERARRA